MFQLIVLHDFVENFYHCPTVLHEIAENYRHRSVVLHALAENYHHCRIVLHMMLLPEVEQRLVSSLCKRGREDSSLLD